MTVYENIYNTHTYMLVIWVYIYICNHRANKKVLQSDKIKEQYTKLSMFLDVSNEDGDSEIKNQIAFKLVRGKKKWNRFEPGNNVRECYDKLMKLWLKKPKGRYTPCLWMRQLSRLKIFLPNWQACAIWFSLRFFYRYKQTYSEMYIGRQKKYNS